MNPFNSTKNSNDRNFIAQNNSSDPITVDEKSKVMNTVGDESFPGVTKGDESFEEQINGQADSPSPARITNPKITSMKKMGNGEENE